jgi:hypothetical protein
MASKIAGKEREGPHVMLTPDGRYMARLGIGGGGVNIYGATKEETLQKWLEARETLVKLRQEL